MKRTLLLLFLATAAAVAPLAAQTTAASTGSIAGIVLDSVRGGTLRTAIVQIQELKREAVTGTDGKYRFENVPAGTYKLRMIHAMLDTLGIAIVTPEFTVAAGQTKNVDLSVPPAHRLVQMYCPPAQRLRGPSALFGFVRDPDNADAAVDSANVQLLWTASDPAGLIKTPMLREAKPDANGRFKICGLPEQLDGKVQVFRRGIASGEVPVKLDYEVLALRGLSFAKANTLVSVAGDSGKMLKVLMGNARLTGRVVTERGVPIDNARVTVPGTLQSAITDARGNFTLDSLPSGSHSVQARKLGYAVAENPVELTAMGPASVTVTMSNAVVVLPAVTSTATAREKDLMDIGYNDRKKRGLAAYMKQGDELNRNAVKMTEMFRDIPGLRISAEDREDGRNVNRLQSARINFICMNYVIDRQPVKMSADEIDQFYKPDEIEAVEFYNSNTTPIEFVVAGSTACPTMVIWTRNKVRSSMLTKRGGG